MRIWVCLLALLALKPAHAQSPDSEDLNRFLSVGTLTTYDATKNDLSLDRFLLERATSMYVDGSVAGFAHFLHLYDEKGIYPRDPRMTLMVKEAKAALLPLQAILPDQPQGLSIAAHALTFFPDPDRTFLIAGLASLRWHAVDAEKMREILPSNHKDRADALLVYRIGRDAYLNPKLFNQSQMLTENLMSGMEYWVLFEALKLWLPTDSDYLRFRTRTARTLQAGSFEAFQVKDEKGRLGLTFLEFNQRLTDQVRKNFNGSWNASNTFFRIKTTPAGSKVRFVAPAQLVAGNYREQIAFQYVFSSPSPLYVRKWADTREATSPIEWPAYALYCDEITRSGSHQVTLTPRVGSYGILPTGPVLNPIQSLTAKQVTFTVTADSCIQQLSAQFEKLTARQIEELSL